MGQKSEVWGQRLEASTVIGGFYYLKVFSSDLWKSYQAHWGSGRPHITHSKSDQITGVNGRRLLRSQYPRNNFKIWLY